MRGDGIGWGSTVLLTAVLVACASPPEELPRPQEGHVPAELVTSLEVQVAQDSVHLRLHVTNVAEEPFQLDFSSGQRYDFSIHEGEREIWRWSEGRGFIQALGSERIPPGGTLSYTASWDPAGRTGTFRAVGIITAMDTPISQQAGFEVHDQP